MNEISGQEDNFSGLEKNLKIALFFFKVIPNFLSSELDFLIKKESHKLLSDCNKMLYSLKKSVHFARKG
jgi:hypothetical protein